MTLNTLYTKGSVLKKQYYLCKNFPVMKYLYCLNIITSLSRNIVNESQVEKIQSNYYSKCHSEFICNTNNLGLKFTIRLDSNYK